METVQPRICFAKINSSFLSVSTVGWGGILTPITTLFTPQGSLLQVLWIKISGLVANTLLEWLQATTMAGSARTSWHSWPACQAAPMPKQLPVSVLCLPYAPSLAVHRRSTNASRQVLCWFLRDCSTCLMSLTLMLLHFFTAIFKLAHISSVAWPFYYRVIWFETRPKPQIAFSATSKDGAAIRTSF